MNNQNGVCFKFARGSRRMAELAIETQDEGFGRNILLCAYEMMECGFVCLYISTEKVLPPKSNLLDLSGMVDIGFINEEERAMLRVLNSCYTEAKDPQQMWVLPSYKEILCMFNDSCKLLERIEDRIKEDTN